MKLLNNNSVNASNVVTEIMTNAEAELVLKTIYTPDPRFQSLGDVDTDIARSDAIVKVVNFVGQIGIDAITNLGGVTYVNKSRVFHDKNRKVTFKRRNPKTGAMEVVKREVSGDCNNGNDDSNSKTVLDEQLSDTASAAETIEENEREEGIKRFYLMIRNSVSKINCPTHAKVAFLLFMKGESYLSIARQVYGYNDSKTNEKKIYENKVSASIHMIYKKLRAAYGEEAKEVLKPVRHVYDRYCYSI